MGNQDLEKLSVKLRAKMVVPGCETDAEVWQKIEKEFPGCHIERIAKYGPLRWLIYFKPFPGSGYYHVVCNRRVGCDRH